MKDLFKEAVKRRPECPPIEVLIESLESPNTRAEIRKHSAECPACQTEIALYQSFEAGAPVSREEREAVDFIVARIRDRALPPRPESVFARFFGGWTTSGSRVGALAVVAAIVIAGVAVTTQWRAGNPEPVADSGVVRSAKIRVTTPLEGLREAPGEIRWQPVPGATSYEIFVSEVDRRVVFYKKFTNPVLLVPSSVARLLVPGKTLMFQVTARDSENNELATTGALTLKVDAVGQ